MINTNNICTDTITWSMMCIKNPLDQASQIDCSTRPTRSPQRRKHNNLTAFTWPRTIHTPTQNRRLPLQVLHRAVKPSNSPSYSSLAKERTISKQSISDSNMNRLTKKKLPGILAPKWCSINTFSNFNLKDICCLIIFQLNSI